MGATRRLLGSLCKLLHGMKAEEAIEGSDASRKWFHGLSRFGTRCCVGEEMICGGCSVESHQADCTLIENAGVAMRLLFDL